MAHLNLVEVFDEIVVGHPIENLKHVTSKTFKILFEMNYQKSIGLYLHSPTTSLEERILEPRGSYTDERHSFTRRYA